MIIHAQPLQPFMMFDRPEVILIFTTRWECALCDGRACDFLVPCVCQIIALSVLYYYYYNIIITILHIVIVRTMMIIIIVIIISFWRVVAGRKFAALQQYYTRPRPQRTGHQTDNDDECAWCTHYRPGVINVFFGPTSF